MKFKSNILIVPGLGNSGVGHWQTLWENEYHFRRVNQDDWNNPNRSDWVEKLNDTVNEYDESTVILVAHSLACSTIGYWATQFNRTIKGALLVAPSDTEADTYPSGTLGFAPMPMLKLSFPSITVTSDNDYYVTQKRAEAFSHSWGSKLITLSKSGHINVEAGFGPWPEGIKLLRELDELN